MKVGIWGALVTTSTARVARGGETDQFRQAEAYVGGRHQLHLADTRCYMNITINVGLP